MEKTEHEQSGRGGIQNIFYSGGNQVINLELPEELIAAIGSNNQVARSIRNMLNPKNAPYNGK